MKNPAPYILFRAVIYIHARTFYRVLQDNRSNYTILLNVRGCSTECLHTEFLVLGCGESYLGRRPASGRASLPPSSPCLTSRTRSTGNGPVPTPPPRRRTCSGYVDFRPSLQNRVLTPPHLFIARRHPYVHFVVPV